MKSTIAVGKLSPIGYYTEEVYYEPVSKKDALMKTLLYETAAVIHVGEGGQPTTVALVDVEKAGTDMKKLETAFMKTNIIN